MQSKWIRFSNGRVWRVVDGLAVGTVVVPNYEEIVELCARSEQIAEAATGSIVGLMDFEYENRGGNVVTFKGSVEHMFDKYPEELTELAEDSDELRAALTAQYGLSRPELLHAMANLKTKRAQTKQRFRSGQAAAASTIQLRAKRPSTREWSSTVLRSSTCVSRSYSHNPRRLWAVCSMRRPRYPRATSQQR